MNISCTRRIAFDAAHRVKKHESKCKNLHGHRYTIEATFAAHRLDDLGRVIDFGIVQELLGSWIDTHWDHSTILCSDDAELGRVIADVTEQKIYYLPHPPTAEVMAHYLLTEVCPDLFAEYQEVHCTRIRLYETPNSYADASA
jgi:6-pyruvoyltetrahydropterin/6-carboxytetrahydropterin synthase